MNFPGLVFPHRSQVYVQPINVIFKSEGKKLKDIFSKYWAGKYWLYCLLDLSSMSERKGKNTNEDFFCLCCL